jgi:DNA repair protein RadC
MMAQIAPPQSTALLSPAEAADALTPYFQELRRERLLIVCLGSCREILSICEAGSASRSGVTGTLRGIIVETLARNASSVLLAHNHPSGDPSPSRTDLETTRRLTELLAQLNVRVEDHLIIADRAWTSMRGLGLL